MNLARIVRPGLAIVFWLLAHASTAATIQGKTTTQDRSVILPGVEVRVLDAANKREVAVVVSDGGGLFRAGGLAAGRYRVVAHLPGFTDATADTEPAAGDTVDLALDLKLAPLLERVNVEGRTEAARLATGSSAATVSAAQLDVLPIMPGSFQAAMPVLPGVMRAPDGQISVKGARPTQGALQVGQGSAIDPSTGAFGVELPTDAIESVEVVANPYHTRDGRFSSSMVKVETRAGTNSWNVSARGLVPFPCLKLCDGESLGIRRYEPRVWVGGPLRKDRLFLAQGVEYRWNRYRVPSLNEGANDFTKQSFGVFTRLDLNLAQGHTLTAAVNVFSRHDDHVNMNTFNPAEVTPDFKGRGTGVTVSATDTLSPTTVLESAVSANRYGVDVSAQAGGIMEITTEGNAGSYFNTQERITRSLQWTESLTRLFKGAAGEHLLNAGIDVMLAGYSGTSVSRPVVVRRADLTASERIDFGGATEQRVQGTNAALYVQDRWRVSSRVLLEPGLRVDRDGVLQQTGFSPRTGVVLRLANGDATVLRGGIGVFRQQTPLNVGAFGSFEKATVTRFAGDGLTPLGPPLTYVHVTSPLLVPRSVIWNVEYDQRVGASLLLKVNYLQRQGTAETLVEPIESGTLAELRLNSRGTSRYAETEVTARYGADEERRLTVSYVHSSSSADSNAFDLFYGNFRNPIVRPGQYSPTPVDVPDRLLVTGVRAFGSGRKWIVSSMVEVRNGFPYSVVDEDQQFVGLRNAGGRFPLFYTLDAQVLRTFSYRGRKFRWGVRANHVLNTFMPRDVQNNIDSPAFRTFYNSFPLRIAFTAQWIG
jgi:hypothetical protein